MRHDEEIDGADRIVRTHQLEFLVPGQIAEMRDPKAAERDDAADRLAFSVGRRPSARNPRSKGFGRPAPGSGNLDHVTGRRHDPPVEPRYRDVVAGLRDRMFRLSRKRRIDVLQELVDAGGGLDVRAVVDEVPDGDAAASSAMAPK